MKGKVKFRGREGRRNIIQESENVVEAVVTAW